MTHKVVVTTFANSTGIVLPEDILEHLQVQESDILLVTELANGIGLSRYDDEEEMTIADRIMDEDRELLRQLADS